MLHLIAEDHGQDLSVALADQIVYNAVREATAVQKVSLQSRSGMRNSHLAAAITRTRDHLDSPIAPMIIAQYLGISTRQLERLFGKYLNASPKKYYMKMRLERARHLLVQTEMSILDVALACGFEIPGHFAKVYRTAFGVTPIMQRGRLSQTAPRPYGHDSLAGRRGCKGPRSGQQTGRASHAAQPMEVGKPAFRADRP
ncbi:helix-turn-helix domain-containing protein [Mameliella alba]|uniref:helix-turn-helix domain-containing protein n=1 Tax=Mameliella alba TaxID=561184 RepID=UPI0017CB62AF|nr:helix-turn-helix domain-containing protein [Mameliella alba]